jgi:hypothetical protein
LAPLARILNETASELRPIRSREWLHTRGNGEIIRVVIRGHSVTNFRPT